MLFTALVTWKGRANIEKPIGQLQERPTPGNVCEWGWEGEAAGSASPKSSHFILGFCERDFM